MIYPKFFDEVEKINVYDPLSELLGAFDGGRYQISYIDIVKGAGHSCPTVAGAYLICLVGLKTLYSEGIATRGDIKVAFKNSLEEGVTGVIANTVSYIIGATDKSGFKGLGGKFSRHSLMFFNQDIESSIRFTRLSTGKSVGLNYDPSVISSDPEMAGLMQKVLSQKATQAEAESFAILWEERVKQILLNYEKVITVL